MNVAYRPALVAALLIPVGAPGAFAQQGARPAQAARQTADTLTAEQLPAVLKSLGHELQSTGKEPAVEFTLAIKTAKQPAVVRATLSFTATEILLIAPLKRVSNPEKIPAARLRMLLARNNRVAPNYYALMTSDRELRMMRSVSVRNLSPAALSVEITRLLDVVREVRADWDSFDGVALQMPEDAGASVGSLRSTTWKAENAETTFVFRPGGVLQAINAPARAQLSGGTPKNADDVNTRFNDIFRQAEDSNDDPRWSQRGAQVNFEHDGKQYHLTIEGDHMTGQLRDRLNHDAASAVALKKIAAGPAAKGR